MTSFRGPQQASLLELLLYLCCGAVLASALNLASIAVRRPWLEQEISSMAQFFPPFIILRGVLLPRNSAAVFASGVLLDMGGMLLFVAIVYWLVRLCNGRGCFKALAEGVVMSSTPSLVLAALLNVFCAGLLVCAIVAVTIALLAYNSYLIMLSAQATLHVPKQRGLLLLLLVFCTQIMLGVGVATTAVVASLVFLSG